MSTISTLRHPAATLFPTRTRDGAFLNAAYMTPLPTKALDAMRDVVDRMARPDFAVDDFFSPIERIRESLARVVGGCARSFSVTGSMSAGASMLAWNLGARADELVGTRRRILGVDGQFPSNVYPWQALEQTGFAMELVASGDGATERLIKRVDSDVALVAIEPLSWTDGRRLDLARVVQAANDAGALTLVDVTQSVGAEPPIPDDVAIDVVVGAGYKWLMGPYGTGFLRLTDALQERLAPLEWNWKNFQGSRDFNRLTEYQREFSSGAARFDFGESSAFLRMAGWLEGLRFLEEVTPAAVGAHGREFARAMRDRLDGDRFTISDVDDEPGQAGHLFRVTPRDERMFEPLAGQLGERGVGISKRDGGWRISPHVYNDETDVDLFIETLG